MDDGPASAGPSAFLDSPAVLVFAHGIVGRADLPIPEELFGVAAAAVLVVSFAALAALWSQPRLERWPHRRLVRLPVAVDVVLGAVGVLALAVTAYAGLAGTGSERDNLAPTVVYVAFWVGVPCVSVLLGDVWRLLSPWRAIGRGAGWVAARFAGDGLPAPLAYPERLGRWPAAAGVIAFGICELCWGTAREPAPLAVLMLVYVVAMLVGMSLYGVEAWTRNADAFGVYFGLFAALAPLERRDGWLVARPPVVGAGRVDGCVAGTVAVLLAGIGVTAFDGTSQGSLFNDLLPHLQDVFAAMGFGRPTALELGFTTGLFATVALVALIWLLARPDPGWPDRSRRSSPPTWSRTTSRCSPTTARTSRGWRPTRSATAATCSGRLPRRSTTASSRRRESGMCRSGRSSSGTWPGSCWRTTARSSSSAATATRPARSWSCWC